MVLRKILLGAAVVLASSCSLFEPGLSVLRGNYAYQQGDYQKSLLFFLLQDQEGSHRERIRYNVGTVYYALGEGNSALDLWQSSRESFDEDVLFALNYNSGIVFYQNGQFGEAYFAFKRALEINPSSVDVKKNLELSLERLEAEKRSPSGNQDRDQPEVSDDARRILQYIKRKEGSRWDSDDSASDLAEDW